MSTNLYKRLIGLLPSNPLQVGEVIAFANGVATIELPGGQLVQARGEVSVADRVFFRGGNIEGPAPALTYEEIEV